MLRWLAGPGKGNWAAPGRRERGKGVRGSAGVFLFFLSFSIPFSKVALKQTNQNKNTTYNTK